MNRKMWHRTNRNCWGTELTGVRWLIAISSIGAVLFANCDHVAKAQTKNTCHADARFDWRLLDFSSGRRVSKVRLIVQPYGLGAVKGQVPTIDMTTTDKSICWLVERGLHRSWRRAPALAAISSSGSETFGELRITTNRETFVVGLYGISFALNSLQAGSPNEFFSWTLAHAVDDLHRQATGKGLDEDKLKILSGEYVLEKERRDYEKIKAPTGVIKED